SNGDLTLSWDDLRQLQSQYGWDSIPRGNADDRSATATQQYADSCSLLPTFYDEGFPNAWGMYAYYGGPYSTTMQSNTVQTCFSFGRTYRVGANPLPVAAPYLVDVFSINGGYCNDTTLPCHSVSAPQEYTLPSALQALVQSAGWDIIQGYKFVSGSYSSNAVSWDCTGADPASHWTSRTELYCYNDWQSVIAAIPATAPVVAPSVVAQLQGRTMHGPLASLVVSPSQATIVPGGSQAFTAEGFDAQGNDLGDQTGATVFSIDGSGSCTGATCTASDPGPHTVTATDGALTTTAQLDVASASPVVTGLTPMPGHVGDTVTITGTDLDLVSSIEFNGSRAAFTVASPGQISATVPVGATDGAVSVTALGGVSQQAGSFTVQPTITSFSPLAASPGATLTISASAFMGAGQVTIAGVPATFTVTSYSSIAATVPSISAGGPVTVTTPDGTATSAGSLGLAPFRSRSPGRASSMRRGC
ncbi:MAG TPA: IPT/TIG domain-containing protein, partial [Gaiellales bacterium]|nr:IPT/TIG domain-containing protein [Gaiellales bacterium]